MQLSVIIAGNGSRTPLKRCLDTLMAQADGDVQVIVAFGAHPALPQDLRAHASRIEYIGVAQPAALHVLRAAALLKATGGLIAILDPYSMPANGWVAAVRRTHRMHANQAIGGPVDLDRAPARGLLDWALYINEYGMFLPPMDEQGMELLPGCNVSYKRSALFDGDVPRSRELWKTFVNDRLVASGETLFIEPTMIVELDKSIAFSDYLLRRFDHGRCYGAMSSAGLSWSARVLRIAAAPLLPFVLLARWSRRFWARGRYRGKLIATLPLQLLMFGWWIAGETVGRVFGAGKSCSRLYY
jgi:hypothetical protein